MTDAASAPDPAGTRTPDQETPDGPIPPLWLRSRNPEEARELVRTMLGISSAFEPKLTDSIPFDFQVRASAVASSYVGYYSCSAETEVRTPDLHDRYAFALPCRGNLTLQQTGSTALLESRTGTMCAMKPDGTIAAELTAQSSFFCIYIDHLSIARELEAELGHAVQQHLSFPQLDIQQHTPELGFFRDLAQLVGEQVARPDGLLERPAVARRLGAALVTTMLHSVPHQYSEALGNTVRPGTAPVRRVTDAMHADPAHPFTQTELAALSGVSLRSLQNAFRDHHGQPLMVYLRNLRLDRAHTDLHTAQRPGTTIADIANRWGFFHHSRFAAYYQQRFGTLPSHDYRH
ncbi:helix-turn-helix transcriptional regulator [Streptomyces sp. NPDC047070]|uniref:AraC family transcriptional regulator n=1 Tax=Streptomyces sp. NPDC047070 TaxID=3154923 RepID=UPI0034571208